MASIHVLQEAERLQDAAVGHSMCTIHSWDAVYLGTCPLMWHKTGAERCACMHLQTGDERCACMHLQRCGSCRMDTLRGALKTLHACCALRCRGSGECTAGDSLFRAPPRIACAHGVHVWAEGGRA
jgi:hypothetical protein